MSRSTKSGASSPTSLRAASPSGAVITSKPSSRRIPEIICRIWGSSSTTSSGPGIIGPIHGKVDDKFGALGHVVFHPDKALVLVHDGADDGQTQAGAPPFGGEVRFEDPDLDPVRDPETGIGDDELNPLLGRFPRNRQ